MTDVEYQLVEFDVLTPAQRDQVQAMYEDPNNPKPAGMETRALAGFVRNGEVVAWLWGSQTTQVGELHLIVKPEHQRKRLGTKLARYYFLLRNAQVERYDLTVTNPRLLKTLNSLGFQPQKDSTTEFTRPRFTDAELATVSQLLG